MTKTEIEKLSLQDGDVIVFRDFDGPARRAHEIAGAIIGFADAQDIKVCKSVVFLRGKERIEVLDEKTLQQLGLMRI